MKKPTSRAYQLMALMELYKRHFKEAIEFAEMAVAISPNDADALYDLGMVMTFADNPKAGIKYFKKSIMLDPLHKDTHGIGAAYFSMGDYEKAVKYIDIGLTDNPERIPMLAFSAASYAFMGNDVEAKKAFEKWLTCFESGYPDVHSLYYLFSRKNLEVFDRLIEGLIKAGFKADSLNYYKVDEKNKLNGQDIKKLTFGKTMTGSYFGFSWSIFRSKDGEAQAPTFWGGIDKGKSWIEGDELCNQFENRYGGNKYCHEVYRNPEGDEKTKSEYLVISDFGFIPFSVKD